MRASLGFIFFMLFIAGLAFVNLQGIKEQADNAVTSAQDIIDTAWRPTNIGEMRLQEDSNMIVQFKTGASLVGHSGCNRFFGDYEISAGVLSIGLLGTTRMACPEPVNSFEISFMEALQSARTLSRTETRLVMRDDKGVIVASFVTTETIDAR